MRLDPNQSLTPPTDLFLREQSWWTTIKSNCFPYIELLWASLYREIKRTSSQSVQIHSIHKQQETQHYAVTWSCRIKEEEEEVRMTSPGRQGTKKQLLFYPLIKSIKSIKSIKIYTKITLDWTGPLAWNEKVRIGLDELSITIITKQNRVGELLL